MSNESSLKRYRAKEAAALLGISTCTFRRWETEGRVPKGTRLTKRCVVWTREQLEAIEKQAIQATT